MQPAACRIDLGVELSARMQRGHDDFERRLLLEFRMRIDRDAAAIVGDGQKPVRLELDFDATGVALHGLVHGVVEHLGEEVMHRLLVGAADIHAGTPAHRLEPFQHLDVGGGVAVLAPFARKLGARGRLRALDRLLPQLVLELGEQVARCSGLAHGVLETPSEAARRICLLRQEEDDVSSHAFAAFSSWPLCCHPGETRDPAVI